MEQKEKQLAGQNDTVIQCEKCRKKSDSLKVKLQSGKDEKNN